MRKKAGRGGLTHKKSECISYHRELNYSLPWTGDG